MSAVIKDNGNWKKLGIPMTRIGGTWRPCKQVWTKVDGSWKKVFDIELADPFDGSGDLNTQETPGGAPWQVVKGGFTKSAGNAVASSLNSVAGLETGTDAGIEVEVDFASSGNAGTGVAFWIQDQSNWWGAHTFYSAYSFFNAPVQTGYYYLCDDSARNYSANFNPSTASGKSVWETRYFLANQGGTYRSYIRRFCRAGGTLGPGTNQEAFECVYPCTDTYGGAVGEPCNAPKYSYNCGNTCSNEACVAPPTAWSAWNISANTPCPTGGFSTYRYASGTCVVGFTYTYDCATSFNTASCTHLSSREAILRTFRTNTDISFDNRNYTPPCAPDSSRGCEASFFPFTIPGNQAFSTLRQTKLIRSQSNLISDVSGTINNVGDGNLIGGMVAQITTNQVRLTAYSGAARNSAAFPTQVYNIPAGTNKGTKHGIIVSGTPNSQGYSISRFKVTM